MKTVTVCITSYNRFSLLKKTIDSFLSLNKFPIERIIVIDDSTNPEIKNLISTNYSNKVEFIFNEINIGQVRSIDKMYKTVTSDYIFHSEDDYLFYGNANFIQDSIDILEEDKSVHQIWIRHADNYRVSHGDINNYLESETLKTSTNVYYKKIISPHCSYWCGFSFNAGLRRTEDYNKMFPNGYSEFQRPDEARWIDEFRCNEHAMKYGYRAAYLLNSACATIGHGAQSSYRQ